MFWSFLWYSFLGFLLEVIYAALTGGEPHRKCLRVLPLCPVYGFGACTILAAGSEITSPVLLFILGAAVATAWEYVMACFYEEVLGVAFWDYSELPWNLQGRVCLPFSLAWGLLTLPLVRVFHPLVQQLDFSPPLALTALMGAALGADVLLSCLLLRATGDRNSLNWAKK